MVNSSTFGCSLSSTHPLLDVACSQLVDMSARRSWMQLDVSLSNTGCNLLLMYQMCDVACSQFIKYELQSVADL